MSRRSERTVLMVVGVGSVLLTGALLSGWDPVSSEAVAADVDRIADCPDPTSPGMREVLDALKFKERAMERRAKSIDDREEDLRRVEEDLQSRLDDLSAMRDELRTLLKDADGEREVRVAGLVKMVESMRAAQAATMVSVLEDDLAVDVLERMNRGKAGKMLSQMDPRKAASLAEQLTVPVLWEDS